ncbi:MAG TPA: FAD-dependent oxidoreductase, partial [Aquificae bacterium]|nr:FAD-dependent oxidoreductase [Aquificota bacterium]
MKDEKVGIVLCTCGNKLKEKIDFEALKAFASNLKDTLVLEVKDFCKNPKEKIKPFLGKIDRLIFAGCSERSSLSFNEDFIQKLLKEINIDPAYFETVNLREQIFNIHTQKDQILNKAKDQLLMAYEKVKSNKPSLKLNKLKKEVLIVGGGVAGQRCAQALADLGIKSTIVEEKTYLGGTATKISLLWQSESYPSSCTSLCIMPVVG